MRDGFGIEQGRGEWVAVDKSRGTRQKITEYYQATIPTTSREEKNAMRF